MGLHFLLLMAKSMPLTAEEFLSSETILVELPREHYHLLSVHGIVIRIT